MLGTDSGSLLELVVDERQKKEHAPKVLLDLKVRGGGGGHDAGARAGRGVGPEAGRPVFCTPRPALGSVWYGPAPLRVHCVLLELARGIRCGGRGLSVCRQD